MEPVNRRIESVLRLSQKTKVECPECSKEHDISHFVLKFPGYYCCDYCSWDCLKKQSEKIREASTKICIECSNEFLSAVTDMKECFRCGILGPYKGM